MSSSTVILTYNAAVEAYARLAGVVRAPAFHPYYVRMDAKRDDALEPQYFWYEEGGECYYHAFHRAQVPGSTYVDHQSPYGYGGPLSTSDDPGFLRNAAQAYLAYCKEQKVLAEFVRFHPLVGNGRFYHGKVLLDRETVFLDLESDYAKEYKKRVKGGLSSSVRDGLNVEWGAGGQKAFQEIYLDRMAEIGAARHYFFNNTYFNETFQWERTHLALCTLQGATLAGALFLCEGDVAEYHLAAATPLGLQLGAPGLILHQAAEWAKARGCRYLHLGGGTDRNPDNRLFFFKAGFSNLRAEFRIGAYVHDSEAYQLLMTNWSHRCGEVPNRVLFYR